MSDDLLRRLDKAPLSTVPMGTLWLYCGQAAARIRELEAEVARLRAELDVLKHRTEDKDYG